MKSNNNIKLADQLHDILLEMKEAGINTSMFYCMRLTKIDGQIHLQGSKRSISNAKAKFAAIGFDISGRCFFIRKNVMLVLA